MNDDPYGFKQAAASMTKKEQRDALIAASGPEHAASWEHLFRRMDEVDQILEAEAKRRKA